ncbi:hypothetical protein [Streptomyces sp. 7N604]
MTVTGPNQAPTAEADDGKHGGNPAPIKPWTPPAPPSPDGDGS